MGVSTGQLRKPLEVAGIYTYNSDEAAIKSFQLIDNIISTNYFRQMESQALP